MRKSLRLIFSVGLSPTQLHVENHKLLRRRLHSGVKQRIANSKQASVSFQISPGGEGRWAHQGLTRLARLHASQPHTSKTPKLLITWVPLFSCGNVKLVPRPAGLSRASGLPGLGAGGPRASGPLLGFGASPGPRGLSRASGLPPGLGASHCQRPLSGLGAGRPGARAQKNCPGFRGGNQLSADRCAVRAPMGVRIYWFKFRQ